MRYRRQDWRKWDARSARLRAKYGVAGIVFRSAVIGFGICAAALLWDVASPAWSEEGYESGNVELMTSRPFVVLAVVGLAVVVGVWHDSRRPARAKRYATEDAAARTHLDP